MEYVIIAILISTLVGFISLIYSVYRERQLFKEGRNPYSRICKKCGSVQDFHRSNIEGEEMNRGWWEEMYPIGNDPECRCHGYAESRN